MVKPNKTAFKKH